MPRDGIMDGNQGVEADGLVFRKPTMDDGSDVWNLIQDINKLDDNSMYCNLLQCSHFAETCALALEGDAIVGWMSGYRPPSATDTLFVSFADLRALCAPLV